jgi:beta-galactosidase
VLDERSMMRLAAGGPAVALPGVYQVRRPLGRMGAPYGQYLQDDVLAGKVHAKMYVFLSAWCLTPAEREKLLAATRGSTRVWCYAPGYEEDHHTSLDAMRELTGFEIKKAGLTRALAKPTAVGQRLGLHDLLGTDANIKPLFAAADATAKETLATYVDGSAAIAVRHHADGVSLFVGTPGVTSELLRLAARKSGVHLFTERDCNVYANGPYLVLHASQDGPLEIDAGAPGPIRDLFSGQSIGEGPKTTLSLKKGDTRVLITGGK